MSEETESWKKYQDILDQEVKPEWNEIDKARDLLFELLDDPDQLIGEEAGAVIDNAIKLIL